MDHSENDHYSSLGSILRSEVNATGSILRSRGGRNLSSEGESLASSSSMEDYNKIQSKLDVMKEKLGISSRRTLTTFGSENTGLSFATDSGRGRGLILDDDEGGETNANTHVQFSNDVAQDEKYINRNPSRSDDVIGSSPRRTRTLYDIGETSVDDYEDQHEREMSRNHSIEQDMMLLENVGNAPDYFGDGANSALNTTRSSGASPSRTRKDKSRESHSREKTRNRSERARSERARAKKRVEKESTSKRSKLGSTRNDTKDSSKSTMDNSGVHEDRNKSKTRKTKSVKIKLDDNPNRIQIQAKKSSRSRKKKEKLPAVMMRQTASSRLRDKEFKKEHSRLEAVKKQENKRPKMKLFIQPRTDVLLVKRNSSRLREQFRRSPDPLRVRTKTATRNVKLDTTDKRHDGNQPMIKKIRKASKRREESLRPSAAAESRTTGKAEIYVHVDRKRDGNRPETFKSQKPINVRSSKSLEKANHSINSHRTGERMKSAGKKVSRKRTEQSPGHRRGRKETMNESNRSGEEKAKDFPITQTTREERLEELPRMNTWKNEEGVPEYVSDDNDDFVSDVSHSMHGSRRSVISSQLELSSWEEMHRYLTDMEKNPEQVLVNLLRGGSGAFHTTAWKSPPALAKKFYRMLSPNEYGMLMSTDADGNTPLHLCCANLAPCDTEEQIIDLGTLEALLERVPECLGKQNNEKDTPLHLFLSSPLVSRFVEPNGSSDDIAVEALELILDKIPFHECFLLKDSSGATPLHAAIANEACETILEFLINMAPIACKSEDLSGMTPLHYAAAFMKTPAVVVERIIEEYSYSICHKTKDGDTPLHLLIRNSSEISEGEYDTRNNNNSLQIVNLLIGSETANGEKELNREYCPLLIQNREKLTPLHCFALFVNAPLEIGEQLMRHPSASKALKITNAYGATPLHISVANTIVSIETIQLFGTLDSAMAKDGLRRTPLHVAAQNAHVSTEVIKSLVEMNPLACNTQSDGGYLPMHLAVHSKARLEIVKELHESFPSGLERESLLGEVPLHKAATNNAPANVVKFLLKDYVGAIYKQNQLGDLPLHCAMSSAASVEIIRMLVQAWAQGVLTQNRAGNSPLHILVKNNAKIELVDLFIKSARSSVLLLDFNGKSPLDIARDNNASNDVIFLLEAAAEEWTKRALDDGWSSFEEIR